MQPSHVSLKSFTPLSEESVGNHIYDKPDVSGIILQDPLLPSPHPWPTFGPTPWAPRRNNPLPSMPPGRWQRSVAKNVLYKKPFPLFCMLCPVAFSFQFFGPTTRWMKWRLDGGIGGFRCFKDRLGHVFRLHDLATKTPTSSLVRELASWMVKCPA